MRQDPVRDGRVEGGEVLLRQALVLPEDTVGMGQADRRLFALRFGFTDAALLEVIESISDARV